MSFYTSLTGLNAATSQLSVTSNNIANVGTTGFKRSRADFGDIFATSPLQKASSAVGQGVSLKQVSQEFSQGNVTSSSNALDLAITGDGFFPLRSADGLQDLYTRNGSFMLNDQFNVVNSSGQRLMAATVDSTGSANVNERVVLTIPQKTSGEAKQTSLVKLGLNFPADAQVIASRFNRADPSTYNKSTAMTVYDKGGNGYLATIYYVKTQNANQSSPTNKWQTYVFVGDEQVNASLVQATNTAGEELYVNQYGQLKPYSEVKDELTTGKTQLISLDELTDKRISESATISSTKAMDTTKFNLTDGVNFKKLITDGNLTRDDLKNVFSLDVDNSGNPVKVDLSFLADVDSLLTGSEIAQAATNYLNRQFGDEAYYDLSTSTNREFTLTTSRITQVSNGVNVPTPIAISLTPSDFGFSTEAQLNKLRPEDIVNAMQTRLDKTIALRSVASTSSSTGSSVHSGAVPASSTTFNSDGTATVLSYALDSNNYLVTTTTQYAANTVKASFDFNARTFNFTDGSSTMTIAQGASGRTNQLFGLTTIPLTLNESGSYGTQVLANGATIRPLTEQRYGIEVGYDSGSKTFSVRSGTTGDNSSIKLTVDFVNGKSLGESLFGMENTEVLTSDVALRGVASQPAIAYGAAPTINVTNNFSVDNTNNKFVVTVDGVKGTVVIPTGADYSVASFSAALQKGINSLANNTDSGMPETVNGVKVNFDYERNSFVFTTGTASSDSFIKISGSANWGLEEVEAGRGTTATWIKPTQHKELVGGQMVPKYIDSQGNETTSADGFTRLPAWSPVYLDKGELTFDTGGKLVSPLGGTQLETVYLAGGKGALTINIDYSASTQFSSAFAVLSQSQDGAPEGDVVGVTIGNDGLVSASYSNGTQKSLAKILLVNFSSPTGLRQMGDSTFVASASSGQPILGTAGTSGLGTIRAGATESSNVDLTSELVNLITAQRNFQANAKAIETSTTLTQAIINIRG
jgi:flagellar hook-basal body protein